MKRMLAILISLALFLPLPALGEAAPRIGALIYNGTDAFMADVFARLVSAAGGVCDLTFWDSQNSQVLQNEQVERLLAMDMDALIVNCVDRTAAVYLIRMAMRQSTPIVFVNREPLYEDLRLYDQAYYVGNNPEEAGRMCGALLVEYFRANPDADRNGDGVIQYVMLKGEPGHQDTELRTIHAVKALQDAGFAIEKLAEDTAMWERATAQDRMSGYLAAFGDRIECVIANNDEMALGAIEALKAAGYFAQGKTLPVVGVDATRYALAALEEGTLVGTVLNDPQGLSDAALQLAVLLAQGLPVDGEHFPYALDRGKYVWTDSEQVTRASLAEAETE